MPESGWYREALNSDAAIYGGSNVGNSGGVLAEPVPAHGLAQSLRLLAQSLRLLVPPLGFLLLKK